jgi:phosphohistidine swiveling domain-containing protein
MLLDVQAYFGAPQDVEWAIDRAGVLFVLQSRPITTIRWRDDVEEYTNADFKDGGVSARVCTRLMFSLYRQAKQPSMQQQFETIGLIERGSPQTWIRSFYGRPYWNASAVKRALLRVPGFHEERFDADLGIQKDYGEAGPRVVPTNAATLARAIPVAIALERSLGQKLGEADAFAATFAAEAEAWSQRAAAFHTLTDERFYADLRGVLLEFHARTERAYFTTIYHNSSAQTELRDLLATIERVTGYTPRLVDLLGGLAGVHHMDVQRGIVRLYRVGVEHGMHGDEWRDALAAFLDAHGFHGDAELDLLEPRWSESPARIEDRIAHMVRSGSAPADPDATESIQQARHLAARGEIEDVLRTRMAWRLWYLPRFRRQLERARAYLCARERLRELSSRCYGIVRTYVCEAGRRLVRSNRLPTIESVFMLEAEEIVRLTEGFWPVAEVAATVSFRQRMYDGYRDFTPPNELGRGVVARSEHYAVTGTRLQGVGCSPGSVVGTARVVSSIDEAATVAPGEILVTRFTDPGWTPVMGHAGAIVTEVGGLLSHAAVIGREYGIPAVLNLAGATRAIKSGQRVRVDGSAGTVDLLDLEGALT